MYYLLFDDQTLRHDVELPDVLPQVFYHIKRHYFSYCAMDYELFFVPLPSNNTFGTRFVED